MTKIIALSLWNNIPKYIYGAARNIELSSQLYPDWQVFLYVDDAAKIAIKEYINLQDYGHVSIINYASQGDWRGMFWRFLPAWDKNIDVMISRDCDSRFSERERDAVNEWLLSDKDFHIMRDHPYHDTCILGGMWGCRNHIFSKLDIDLNIDEHGSFWQVDQDFLRSFVYPKVMPFSFIHDDYNHFNEPQTVKFPTARINKHFVGEIFDENNNRHPDHYLML